MMLTTSDVHTMVTQGIRAKYGRLIDPETTFNTWIAEHDQAVINAAFAFIDAPTPVLLAPAEIVDRLTAIAEHLRGEVRVS